MNLKTITATFALLCATSTSLLAAATAEEAARIKTVLQNYVGAEPGVVEVAAAGDDYMITFDAAPLIKKYQKDGFSAKFDPLVFKATPNGDGTWALSTSSPYALNYQVANMMVADMSAATMQWSGTFDEALGAFTNSTYAATGIKVVQTISDTKALVSSKIDYAIAELNGESTSVAAGDGIADSSNTMTMNGIASTTTSTGSASGGFALNYTTKIESAAYASTIKGFRVRAVMDLLAWLVAHPSKETIIADQAQLKEKITAALPLWDNLDGGYTSKNLLIGTGMGEFSLETAGISANANGAVKDGSLREGFSFTGFKIPAGIAPPWSAELLPTTFKFDFALGGFDLETPAKKMLAEIDLAKEPPLPTGFETQLLPIFLPGNAVSVTLHPSEISSATYAVTYEGKIDASLAGFPKGQVTIQMTGMEDVIAKVQAAAAADPMAQQAMGVLVAAKGFGKADADGKLVWAIEMTPDNKVLINGLDVSAMLGIAPPAP